MEPCCVFGPLNADWAVISVGPTARRGARRWAQADARLAGYATPAAVLTAKERAVSADANDILAALIGVGDQLAVRTALQALLPLVARHFTRACQRGQVGSGRAWGSAADLASELIAELWVWLDRRAGREVSWPASRCDGALADFVAGAVVSHRSRVCVTATLDPDRHDGGQRPDGLVRCARLLIDAHRDGAIDTLTAQLLYGVAVRGDTVAEVAERAGIAPATLQKHRRRHELVLAAPWVAA